jgi:hypothetical protein
MKKSLIAVMILGTVCTSAFAGESGSDAKDLKQPIITQNIKTIDYFRSQEWSVDLFGTYTAPENGKINDGWGGGGGINYFFTKYFGLGVEGGAFDGGSTADTVTYADAMLIARYPIDAWGMHLAPYVFGGGGWHWGSADIDGAIGFAGLGAEYRFTPHIGVFIDGRYVWGDSSNDYGLARVGIRYAF